MYKKIIYINLIIVFLLFFNYFYSFEESDSLKFNTYSSINKHFITSLLEDYDWNLDSEPLDVLNLNPSFFDYQFQIENDIYRVWFTDELVITKDFNSYLIIEDTDIIKSLKTHLEKSSTYLYFIELNSLPLIFL